MLKFLIQIVELPYNWSTAETRDHGTDDHNSITAKSSRASRPITTTKTVWRTACRLCFCGNWKVAHRAAIQISIHALQTYNAVGEVSIDKITTCTLYRCNSQWQVEHAFSEWPQYTRQTTGSAIQTDKTTLTYSDEQRNSKFAVTGDNGKSSEE